MTTVAISMVKDEEDVIRDSVTWMMHQVDHVLVADNLSTDGTRAILDELGVDVLEDPDPAYRQSEKMTALAQAAVVQYGADWIVPFDADELWFAYGHRRVAEALATLPDDTWIATATLYDHVATGLDDDEETSPFLRMGWRRVTPGGLPKVACRWREDLVIEQGNHGAHYTNMVPTRIDGVLEVRHFPYRSATQFVRKAINGKAAYDATDLPYSAGAHWRMYGGIAEERGDEACADWFREHFFAPDPEAGLKGEPLVYDPATR
jgi:hypothetical protein